jgi:hypothetical protein
MSTADTILYGVIAGISTSFIIFLLVQIFNKIIVPWYKSTIYSGLVIDGVWEEEYDHATASDIAKLAITQNGQALKGLMTVVKHNKKTGETVVKNFILKGSFHDGHVILSGNNANSKYRGHVTYLLKISNGGRALVGVMSWVDSGSDRIGSLETILIRENA